MKKALSLMLVIVIIFLMGCTAAKPQGNAQPKYQSYKDIPDVTQMEIDAIEALKAKHGAFSYGHLAITESFKQPDGTYAGFTIEVCKLLSRLFQVEFTPKVYSDWAVLKSDIDNNITNFSGEFTQTSERMDMYEMSIPIAGRGLNIYNLKSAPEITEEADINGMRVGFLCGAIAAELIVERYPDNTFEAVDVPGFPEAAEMLLSGEIDAFVTDNVVDTMFNGYDYIRDKDIFQFVYAPVSITTKDPELKPIISVINKYLDAGGMDTMFELYREGSYEYKKYKLNQSFTDEERAYLERLKQQGAEVNVALQHDAYPASFYNTMEERYDGAAYDILMEVSELTGIVFNSDCMPIKKPLFDILARLKTDEVSMMPQLLYSESRKNDYIWSGISYITTNYALLSKTEYPTLQPFQVYYATVGTVNKSAHEEVFKGLFPDHNKTIVYQTGDDGFDALESGEIDLLMLSETMLLVQTNYREKLGYKVNLTFNKTLDTLFGYNKDEVILRDIIDKSMAFIDVEGIKENWVSRAFDYQSKMLRDAIPYIVLFVAMLLMSLIVVIVLFVKNKRINRNLEKLVTERTNELLIAKELAEQGSRSKSDFLSRMSHEIRTPLNAVLGMNSIAMNTDDLAKMRNCHEKIDNASKHLLGVINDILDMSKIEADKFELTYSEFDFEKALMNITNVINFRADEKSQNLVVNIVRGVPEFIIGDELRLSQVITNLLSNAVKFTPENGTVVLSVQKIADADKEVTLQIDITDNGIGISKEQQSRLFTSFEQADGSISRKFGGTGLGLAISKRIVELMGGRIWIESEIGKGSKFSLTIKAEKGRGKEHSKLSPEINMDNLHILAVDDSEETRICIAHIMEAHSLPCDIAANGIEALNMIKQHKDRPYNVFFIDWRMPDMDGIELTKKIKEITGDGSVVFMISTADWNAIEKEALSAGVKQFVPKPLFPSLLIDAVNECLGAESAKTKIQAWGMNNSPRFKGHTILIAEDIDINQEIMAAVLEETGVSIDFADNGSIAVSMFKAAPDKYSLILMDIHMPEMDGYETTRKIRSLEVGQARHIPIVAMTANVFKEDIENCMLAGMNDHIGKPVDANDLFTKLRKYLL